MTSIYRRKLLGLDKTSSVAYRPYNSGETQTCNFFVLLFGRDWARFPAVLGVRFLSFSQPPSTLFCV